MNSMVGFLRALAGKVIVPQIERKLRRFESQLETARRVQGELWRRKIERCADSQFGRDHHFRGIKTLEDFRRNIPIAQYDYYQPYIQQVTEGNVGAMFPSNEKLLMYTLSSGTTDAPKLIPITKPWMAEYRAGWQIWGVKAFLDHHPLFYSKLTGIAGNWDMRRTPTNIPCGMASGLSARMQSPLLRMMYCVPPEIYGIDDVEAKYYACLRLSIPEKVGLFLTATPATVVNFAQLGDRHRETIIRDVHDGTLSDAFTWTDAIRSMMRSRIKGPNPERARELEAIVERTGHLHPKDYWDLSLVACWLGGTVGTYARRIGEYYGETPCRDIGLLCSEGRFTIPLEDGTPSGALEIASHYYEFVPEEEIDSSDPTVLEGHELEVGKDYYILLTTSCGLYRYDIHDLMRCTGFIGETPLLEFLNKGQRFSDMEGEKLSEFHLVRAVADSANQLGMSLTGFTAVPVRPPTESEQTPPYYALLVEQQDIANSEQASTFLTSVDRWLCDHNVMYQGKRADRYLGPPRLVVIPQGSWREYDQAEIKRRGVGEDHYKHPCLLLDSSILDRFPIIEEIVPTDTASVG
ncbi:GH3 auxin-responsive promoter [Planctomycetes bacterium Pan216]|uniref:GH3 auxin-responsive promoter n=1 Tax=Kolteria novifilia TaxID=2527975 RepID=A0A518AY63_9BACT|nr:GH3 auxin-responsive promoter [Planctomycetes bacterium Pan216]